MYGSTLRMSILPVLSSPRTVQDGGYGFDTLENEIPQITAAMDITYYSQTRFAQLVKSEVGETARIGCDIHYVIRLHRRGNCNVAYPLRVRIPTTT
jgi:hypothetical protein